MRGEHEIVAILIDSALDGPQELCGIPTFYGKGRFRELLDRGVEAAIIAIGDCAVRHKLAADAEREGFKLAHAVHPRAYVGQGASFGPGTMIMAGAIVQPGAVIGDNVILNTACTIGHHCIVQDGAHVASGTNIGGHAIIGARTWVGIGSSVRDRVEIGGDCMIGAGSVVVNNIPPGSLAYGVPARVISQYGPPRSPVL
jgi:sugar O-acyltransferase (sialic acid O-acetyltransferase NeuD family)